MTDPTWQDARRSPSVDRNPLDRASFYVESLKYGPGEGKLELAGPGEIEGQLDVLLCDAGVTSLSGQELLRAMMYYGESTSQTYGLDRVVAVSVWLDGLMHGMALAGRVEGEHRQPKGQ